ncbi:signal peptidase I [Pigmentibacter sp. JX0631]|uniref:signal peptidase I n=1 Tax=Pigmentibacter sp. JX0631 TaxID=2976982 RepID=UPI0024696AAD|nr:signal peptidase I [Pigmentibacter sp. JX0631]WGL58976.1 signal peptidase I [Pigmentibacter sp. JX0631]
MKYLKEFKEIFIIIFCIFVFRSSFVNWYVIPSGSMLPTLKIGDHVVVNKMAYGFMLPFMETRIFSWSKPQRGEIVVFQGPPQEGGQVLIKRIVAIENDKVEFVKGLLHVNGVPVQESIENNREVLTDTGSADDFNDYNLIKETSLSQNSFYILKKKNEGMTFMEKKTWIVPAGKLFFLGDNRDNSFDSRFWGMIDEKSIYGKAFFISYSTGDKGMWPHFRKDRFFQKLQ